MPAVVWADKSGSRSNDPELQDMVNEVCELTGGKWVVDDFYMERKRLFRESIFERLHTLYAETVAGEWQVINFAGGASSIHSTVDRADIINYLNGVITGWNDHDVDG